MRIHTDTLTRRDIFDAAVIARVDLATFTSHGSRSRHHAYTIKLEGESRRRPNGGASGAGSGYAATWDQWGVFLGVLFDRDPSMVTPYYADADAFHWQTADRFADRSADVDYATGPVFWPSDAHGDHRFDFSGTPFQQECTRCSAIKRWDR